LVVGAHALAAFGAPLYANRSEIVKIQQAVEKPDASRKLITGF
jgi:hypothetical protein